MNVKNINFGFLNYNESSKYKELSDCDIVMRRNANGDCVEVVKNIYGKTGLIRNYKTFKINFFVFKIRISID